jgi:hypothetical protein
MWAQVRKGGACMSEPTITRNGHDKIIRFDKPIQAWVSVEDRLPDMEKL